MTVGLIFGALATRRKGCFMYKKVLFKFFADAKNTADSALHEFAEKAEREGTAPGTNVRRRKTPVL